MSDRDGMPHSTASSPQQPGQAAFSSAEYLQDWGSLEGALVVPARSISRGLQAARAHLHVSEGTWYYSGSGSNTCGPHRPLPS